MGLMDFVRAAVPLTAAARVGYGEGEDEKKRENAGLLRQAMLDQQAREKNAAEIGELGARGDYYRSGGAAMRGYIVRSTPNGLMVLDKATGQPVRQATPDDISTLGVENEEPGEAGGPVSPVDMVRSAFGMPPRSTTPSNGINVDTSNLPTVGLDQQPPTGSTNKSPLGSRSSPNYVVPGSAPPPKPVKPAAGPHVARAHIVDPGTGNIINVMSDGSAQVVRKATPQEIAKATHIGGSGGGGGGAGAGGYSANDARADKAAQGLVSGAIAAASGDTTAARANLNKSAMNPAVRSSINGNPSIMGQMKQAYDAGKTKATDAHTRTQYSTPGMMRSADSTNRAMQSEIDRADQQLQSILGNPSAPADVKKRAQAAHDQRIRSITQKYMQPAGGGGDNDELE